MNDFGTLVVWKPLQLFRNGAEGSWSPTDCAHARWEWLTADTVRPEPIRVSQGTRQTQHLSTSILRWLPAVGRAGVSLDGERRHGSRGRTLLPREHEVPQLCVSPRPLSATADPVHGAHTSHAPLHRWDSGAWPAGCSRFRPLRCDLLPTGTSRATPAGCGPRGPCACQAQGRCVWFVSATIASLGAEACLQPSDTCTRGVSACSFSTPPAIRASRARPRGPAARSRGRDTPRFYQFERFWAPT